MFLFFFFFFFFFVVVRFYFRGVDQFGKWSMTLHLPRPGRPFIPNEPFPINDRLLTRRSFFVPPFYLVAVVVVVAVVVAFVVFVAVVVVLRRLGSRIVPATWHSFRQSFLISELFFFCCCCNFTTGRRL